MRDRGIKQTSSHRQPFIAQKLTVDLSSLPFIRNSRHWGRHFFTARIETHIYLRGFRQVNHSQTFHPADSRIAGGETIPPQSSSLQHYSWFGPRLLPSASL